MKNWMFVPGSNGTLVFISVVKGDRIISKVNNSGVVWEVNFGIERDRRL